MSTFVENQAATPASKRALIEQILQRKRALSRQHLGVQERPAQIPMSYGQERLWHIEQIGMANGAYNISAGLRLKGRLDVEALSRAVSTVVERHEALRTRFPIHQTQGVQVVDPPEPVVLQPTDVAEDDLVGAMTRFSSPPFDLATDRLCRFTLLRLHGEEHVLVFVLHHIISDGWSVSVLVRELASLYSAFCRGEASPLEPLPLQYADYAIWQRRMIDAGSIQNELAYWREALADAPPSLDLPTDRPRPPTSSSKGARLRVQVPTGLVVQLTDLAKKEGATLYMVLVAALNVVLARWSGQEDIVVGSPIAGRDQVLTEPLIGFFLNIVALRTDLSGNPSFVRLLAQVRHRTLDAFANQSAPFDRVVAEIQPERDMSRHPIFQVLFVLQNLPKRDIGFGDLRSSPVADAKATTKMDLSLNLRQIDDGLSGSMEYATDLFDESTVQRFVQNWLTLLEQVVRDPHGRVLDVPMLSAPERDRILGEWAGSVAATGGDTALHHLFESQAASTPDAIAVVAGTRQLSYCELEARANQLAQALVAAGVVPETVVGLRIDRDVELLIGLLAILKAGGVYLPVDPMLPGDRARYMLDNANARLLLTCARVADPEIEAGRTCLQVDGELAVDSAWLQWRAPAVAPDNLAYVIFTSGSTGLPKGVMATHRGVVNYMRFLNGNYALGPGDRVLNVSGIGFDPSLRDLLGPLTSGGTAVLVTGAEVLDAARYWETIRREGVTRLLSITPSFLRALCHAAEESPGPHALRDILTCGETLDSSVVARVRAVLGSDTRIVNQYGPTECSMSTTWHVATEQDTAVVPIGRPLPNARIHVLDNRMHPVPAGVTGELYIGGTGLTRGYLGRPDLTADRYVPNPFVPGERLYRTGDHVRWSADGRLLYLGRTDFQVKLRGVRVELGEIVAALNALPDVEQSAVLVHGEGEEQRLVAYVVPAQGPLSAERLVGKLKARLPAALIPGAFVPIDKLPMTRNGKLDRKALPEPEAGMLRQRFCAPVTDTEQGIAGIFSSLLKVAQVGRDDNFFTLGGHSLLAMRVMAKIVDAFGVRPALRVLFEKPSVAALAAEVDELVAAVPASQEDLLASIEQLSDEDAARLLKELAN